MWPPIEMFGIVNVISRFSPIQKPRPLSMRLSPRSARDHDRRAHQPEDRPGGAHGQAVAPSEQRAERAREERHEVDEPEAQRPDRRLEHRAEDAEREHVEQQVEEPGVQEPGGHEPPVLAVRRSRLRESAPSSSERAALPSPPPAPPPSSEPSPTSTLIPIST